MILATHVLGFGWVDIVVTMGSRDKCRHFAF
jgi:hypothetical protein